MFILCLDLKMKVNNVCIKKKCFFKKFFFVLKLINKVVYKMFNLFEICKVESDKIKYFFLVFDFNYKFS